MKKIGILTFFNVQNYGAVLQAYTLQKLLEEMQCEPELIRYIEYKSDETSEKKNDCFIRRYFNILLMANFNILNFIKTYQLVPEIQKKFIDFREEFLNISREHYSNIKELEKANYFYDSFLCGSDMVWTDIGQNLDVYFLKFAPYNKRSSYAPSLTAVNFDDKKQILFLKEAVNGIKHLSCREEYGVNVIKEITGRDAFLALDPTLLLNKEQWSDNLRIKSNDSEKYILCYMFQGIPGRLKKKLIRMANKTGLSIRCIPMTTSESIYELKNGHSAVYGPKEFVELFYNASFVVTNSFHGLIFSLNFHKPFVLISRSDTNKWKQHEKRMENILELVGLTDRIIEETDDINYDHLKLDYSQSISKVINTEREKSKDYLRRMIADVEISERKNAEIYNRIDELPFQECTGCMACANVCPQNCISFENNKEGFKYPFINNNLCIKCGICASKCPSINMCKFFSPKKAMIALGNNSCVNASASGGAFVTIAKYLIEEKSAVVFGASYNENYSKVRHIFVSDVNDLRLLQNSKYVQSEIACAYLECKRQLENNRVVLFTGTPCQISGLRNYLGREYENLYTMDIICHGVPSPLFYEKWISMLKEFYGEDIKKFTFRHKDKKELRSAFELKITFDNRVVFIPSYYDPYYKLFISEDTYRESCYVCNYAKEYRVGDFTIGDCDSWREYEEIMPEGAKSSVIINTEKALNLWEEVKGLFTFTELDYQKECRINHQLRRPCPRKPVRDTVYDDVFGMDWEQFAKKYGYKKPDLLKRIAVNIIKFISKE